MKNITALEKLAVNGDTQALYELGNIYDFGRISFTILTNKASSFLGIGTRHLNILPQRQHLVIQNLFVSWVLSLSDNNLTIIQPPYIGLDTM